MNTESQERMILKHLQRGGAVTPLFALKHFGCLRLGARIYDLKQKGHDIQRQMIKFIDGKRVAEYRLLK